MNDRVWYNKALVLLQDAHDACYKNECRDVLEMSTGPFSGVNQVLGMFALIEIEINALKMKISKLESAKNV